jgi:hypothetical protein
MAAFSYGDLNQRGMTNQPMSVQEIDSILPPGSYYFSGNEAATEGAIAAGCRYYGGYPITPSSEIMESRKSLFFGVLKTTHGGLYAEHDL